MTDRLTVGVPDGPSGDERGTTDSAARIFRLGGQWYFSTRDGDIGPFRSRDQARREATARYTVLKPR